MKIELWLAFVAASSFLLIIPGPTILTVMSYSIAHGRTAKLPLIAAVALGDSTALLISLLGLGALMTTSAVWFTAIKWIGGLYLLYMGINLIRAGTTSVELTTPPAAESKWRLCANTWLVTALNPKGIILFAAFLPQFLDTAVPVTLQLWILSLTFVALATLNASGYAIFAGSARRMLSSTRARKRFNLAGGSLLSAAGLWALTAKHSS
ncbi:MAG: threonine/homoserine/homoserine lactone efflux protein [bacterium]|jgi:threonine/homoserine/homoserine lactone efflux protein